MRLSDITPLILTYNEQANIERTLAKLDWASRIVVIDSFSTDRTSAILAANPRVAIFTRPFESFADQCNFGLTMIDTPWVLSLDADYVCTDPLIREIEALSDEPVENGFQVAFTYCISGRPLRRSLYPPRTVLYRRQRASYLSDGHAHRVVVDGAIGKLSSRLLHDDRKPLDSWLRAQDRYAEREALKLAATPQEELGFSDRIRTRKWLAPLAMPLYCLIGKGLILDGWAGLEYALQRTYAELLLSLKFIAYTAESDVARNRHSSLGLLVPDRTVERNDLPSLSDSAPRQVS